MAREYGSLERMNVPIATLESYVAVKLKDDNTELAEMVRDAVAEIRTLHRTSLESVRLLGGR